MLDSDTKELCPPQLDKNLTIYSKNEMLQEVMKEYKKQHTEMIKVGSTEDVNTIVERLYNVLEITNTLASKLKLDTEKTKEKISLQRSEKLECLKL